MFFFNFELHVFSHASRPLQGVSKKDNRNLESSSAPNI